MPGTDWPNGAVRLLESRLAALDLCQAFLDFAQEPVVVVDQHVGSGTALPERADGATLADGRVGGNQRQVVHAGCRGDKAISWVGRKRGTQLL